MNDSDCFCKSGIGRQWLKTEPNWLTRNWTGPWSGLVGRRPFHALNPFGGSRPQPNRKFPLFSLRPIVALYQPPPTAFFLLDHHHDGRLMQTSPRKQLFPAPVQKKHPFCAGPTFPMRIWNQKRSPPTHSKINCNLPFIYLHMVIIHILHIFPSNFPVLVFSIPSPSLWTGFLLAWSVRPISKFHLFFHLGSGYIGCFGWFLSGFFCFQIGKFDLIPLFLLSWNLWFVGGFLLFLVCQWGLWMRGTAMGR